MTSTTPEDQAALALAGTPTTQLLRAAYALTHCIHAAEQDGRGVPLNARDDLRDLRAQRDLIDAEVLRRTSDR